MLLKHILMYGNQVANLTLDYLVIIDYELVRDENVCLFWANSPFSGNSQQMTFLTEAHGVLYGIISCSMLLEPLVEIHEVGFLL